MQSPFLDSVTEMMRLKRYAKRTIETYIYWMKAFINFNHQRHPIKCHDREVEQFLSYLANQCNVTPNTQALALNAVVFLYKVILAKPLTLELNFNRTTAQPKLPIVITVEETALLLRNRENRGHLNLFKANILILKNSINGCLTFFLPTRAVTHERCQILNKMLFLHQTVLYLVTHRNKLWLIYAPLF